MNVDEIWSLLPRRRKMMRDRKPEVHISPLSDWPWWWKNPRIKQMQLISGWRGMLWGKVSMVWWTRPMHKTLDQSWKNSSQRYGFIFTITIYFSSTSPNLPIHSDQALQAACICKSVHIHVGSELIKFLQYCTVNNIRPQRLHALLCTCHMLSPVWISILRICWWPSCVAQNTSYETCNFFSLYCDTNTPPQLWDCQILIGRIMQNVFLRVQLKSKGEILNALGILGWF